ncbi:MAG TPA: bacillithiol biosynthesis deacetylase BshB1 [Candidatus Eisenbacteria bacterium]
MNGLDALFVGPHPDDVELTSGGLAALLASHGHRVGIVDLTRGELGSRGTPEERAREAELAARELGVALRENLGLPDLGLDRARREQLAAVVACLRRHRPRLVVAPDSDDAHPDHVEAAHLVARACYVAGLARFEGGEGRHRPERLLFALYRTGARPQLVVDVSAVWARRWAAIQAHRSQLGSGPAAGGPVTYLTPPGFLAEIEGRARHWGALVGAAYGEGYRSRGPLAVTDARVLISGAHAAAGGA